MGQLLELAMEAHGGMQRWLTFSDLVTNVGVHGELCERNGWTGPVPTSRMLLSLREHRTVVTIPPVGDNVIVEPGIVTLMKERKEDRRVLRHPRRVLLQEKENTVWDVLRTSYFFAHVIRFSVTVPFVYASKGFTIEEVEPRIENGEPWRGLKVTLPPALEAPITFQVAHYGADGLLRRLYSKVDVLGVSDLVEYVADYKQVSGIWIPTLKHVFACGSDGETLGRDCIGNIRLLDVLLID
ncbi:MAG: hypothetical protein PW792_10365 [Acidobacteriaceae bacterium]|nr:hypothetical protein [Acidobacteriaceae bacterium]